MPDIDNATFDDDALLKQLRATAPGFPEHDPNAPASSTMPVDAPRRDVVADTAPQASPVRAAGPGPSQGYQGAAPKFHQAMEGFPVDRDYNTNKSAKDAFAVLANAEGVPPAPIHDKQALAAWVQQYIVPGMEDQGHQISAIDGDKFHLKNWQGDFDVDYGRGAGADGGALAWQVQEPTAQLSNAAYQPRSAQAIGATREGTSDDGMAQILKEIQALQEGSTSPMDEEALMALLRV